MRNTPETRFSRAYQAVEELATLLAPSELQDSFPAFHGWHERLEKLQESVLAQRDNMDFALVVFAGSSGSGKSTLLNALTRGNLAPVGSQRPTTKDILAFASEEAEMESEGDLFGLSQITVVEIDSSLTFPEWLLAVEIPDPKLFETEDPQKSAKVEHLLELADVTVWATDPQKYADAEFLSDLHRWANPLNSLVVLTHIDSLPPDSVETVVKDFQDIAAQRGLSLPILATSIYQDSSLAGFREKVFELAELPESRYRAMSCRLQRTARRIAADARVETVLKTDDQEAGEQFRQNIAKACGIGALSEQLRKSYLRASRPFMLFPPFAWLAGAAPLAQPEPFDPPQANSQEVNAAARDFVDKVAPGYPKEWNDFFHRQSKHYSTALTQALNLAMSSWEAPQTGNKPWWRLWWVWHWVCFVALAVTSIWTLIWFVCLLGGIHIPGSVGSIPLAPLCFGGVILIEVLWSVAGIKISGSRARKFGESGSQKFRQLLDEVSQKAFFNPMNQDITLYTQVRELTGQMGGI